MATRKNKKNKLKKFCKYEIEWIDTVSGFHNWSFIEDIKCNFSDLDILTHYSCGFLIAETKLSIILAMSIQKKIYSGNDRLVVDTIEIPKSAIKKIRLLR